MSDVPNPPAGAPGPAPLAFPAPYADHTIAPWLLADELRQFCGDAESLDDVTLTLICGAATEMLYYASGQQFGLRTSSFRPCIQCYCNLKHRCRCRVPQIDCGNLFPVNNIISVHFNGLSQPVADFHIDAYRYIVRNDGEEFPRENVIWDHATAAQDADGYAPFEIAVGYGYTHPRLADIAVRAMACELTGAFAGSTCALPDRVVSYTRQGVSAQVTSPQDLLNGGSSGVYAVDLFIKTYNPNKLQSSAFVWSPDTQIGARRTYTSG